ncbi:hypothetical protein BZG36_00405 [Bifiguratus adelaidae]|uniref:Centrosomin N-terminal motif 1 domain-containing protein n=1 Tax=Bifiguratus adelaidae TaxID=1938954 RepID=A0A261Y819_9FUNG|nr:hypothetical protein BZG36_00405 [Bifiguratus adelaidae]
MDGRGYRRGPGQVKTPFLGSPPGVRSPQRKQFEIRLAHNTAEPIRELSTLSPEDRKALLRGGGSFILLSEDKHGRTIGSDDSHQRRTSLGSGLSGSTLQANGWPYHGDNHSDAQEPSISASDPGRTSMKGVALREMEQAITQLRKENFDLKMQLFHYQKDVDRGNVEAISQHEIKILRSMLQERTNELERTVKELQDTKQRLYIMKASLRALLQEGMATEETGETHDSDFNNEQYNQHNDFHVYSRYLSSKQDTSNSWSKFSQHSQQVLNGSNHIHQTPPSSSRSTETKINNTTSQLLSRDDHDMIFLQSSLSTPVSRRLPSPDTPEGYISEESPVNTGSTFLTKAGSSPSATVHSEDTVRDSKDLVESEDEFVTAQSSYVNSELATSQSDSSLNAKAREARGTRVTPMPQDNEDDMEKFFQDLRFLSLKRERPGMRHTFSTANQQERLDQELQSRVSPLLEHQHPPSSSLPLDDTYNDKNASKVTGSTTSPPFLQRLTQKELYLKRKPPRQEDVSLIPEVAQDTH